MKRQIIRLLLALTLVVVTILAALVWTGSYQKNPDPKALFEITGAKVSSDHSFFWIELHLEKAGEKNHFLENPIKLVTEDGKVYLPADTTFAGSQETGFNEMWIKFWVEEEDTKGKLFLEMNEGRLNVKSNQGLPNLTGDSEKIFRSNNWSKTWLGF